MHRKHSNKKKPSYFEHWWSKIDHTVVLHHPALHTTRGANQNSWNAQRSSGWLSLHHFDCLEDSNDLQDAQNLCNPQHSCLTIYSICTAFLCTRLPAQWRDQWVIILICSLFIQSFFVSENIHSPRIIGCRMIPWNWNVEDKFWIQNTVAIKMKPWNLFFTFKL